MQAATPPIPDWIELPGKVLPAPEFIVPQLDSEPIELAEYTGTPVLLHFWATFCAPCLDELPALKQLAARCDGSALQVITIAVDRNAPAAVERVIKRLRFDLPVGLDPHGTVRKRYEIIALPTTYFIDREMQIRGRTIGQREWGDAEAVAAIQALLATCE